MQRRGRTDLGADDPEIGDGELVLAARQGDGEAVTRLLTRHEGAVRFVIRDRVRDEDMVEDLVQECFARALERLDDVRRPECFRSWLLSIARNVATDRWRHERRQLSEDEEELDRRLEPSASTEDQAEQRELADHVAEALGGLPQRDALAIALSAYLDLDVQELSVALGVTPGTAKVVLHRARRRLRTQLVVEALTATPEQACPVFRETPPDDRARHVAECTPCVDGARRTFGRAVPRDRTA